MLRAMRTELEHELTAGILSFWVNNAIDETHGGFVGYIADDGTRNEDAPKGSILNARILWAFSAAYRTLGDDVYREMADRAECYFRERFVDTTHGGVYWTLSATGAPLDDRKHVYAQAFAIYGLSEHFRATGCEASLLAAVGIFRLIERRAHDAVHGGYDEAFGRDWVPHHDARLSDDDADERRSMNTHLHLLEAYTNLYRIWRDPMLRHRLVELIGLFVRHIFDHKTGHLRLFFDRDWTAKSDVISFGHDIEASWLLLEAAGVLGDDVMRARVLPICTALATSVLDQALDTNGGIFYEAASSVEIDTDKEWWPQAEGIVGFLSAYHETGRDAFLHAALKTWEFTKRCIVDVERGDWHRRVARDGSLRPGHEKVGPWKCPYHNARACLEVMARVDARAEAEV